jgi:glycosyltransferase involved in cell wall biosynthesis
VEEGQLTFSVVIPCRNADGTIEAAIRSVLAQVPKPCEVIVVDDASTDDSVEIARRSGAQVISLPDRRNAGGARNVGVASSIGTVVVFVDADVELSANWLATVSDVLREDRTIGAVGGRIVNGRPGRYGDLDLWMNHSEWTSTKRKFCRAYPTMAIAYRRAAIGSNRFPETNHGDDTLFALAVCSSGWKIVFEPCVEVVHRHERLDGRRFWGRQVEAGRQLFVTRMIAELPGQMLCRVPALLFLFPHLWVILCRMIREGHALLAVRRFPWLMIGEIARMVGFLDARRAFLARAPRAPRGGV